MGKSSKESCDTISCDNAEATVAGRAFRALTIMFLELHRADSLGGIMRSAKSISSRPISSGSLPNAMFSRFAEAYTFTARGNRDPFTFSKSSAGFCSRKARTAISVTSSLGSTCALILRSSPFDSRYLTNSPRAGKTIGALLKFLGPPPPGLPRPYHTEHFVDECIDVFIDALGHKIQRRRDRHDHDAVTRQSCTLFQRQARQRGLSHTENEFKPLFEGDLSTSCNERIADA